MDLRYSPYVCRVITEIVRAGSSLLNACFDFSGTHLFFDGGILKDNTIQFSVVVHPDAVTRIVFARVGPTGGVIDAEAHTKTIGAYIQKAYADSMTKFFEETGFRPDDPTFRSRGRDS